MDNDTTKIKEEVPDEIEDQNMMLDEQDVELSPSDDPNTLGPAALGLQRVGTQPPPRPPPSQPVQVLNARGMPARIRKKNKLFFDDDIVNTPHHRVPNMKKQKLSSSPNKKIKSYSPGSVKVKSEHSTPKTPGSRRNNSHCRTLSEVPARLNSPDRKIGQKIGLRLRNLLKLPKAHKWVCYEWFYSNIDRCLFSGENDFQICLKESFPSLETRELPRTVWRKIRRMMGKPRRCSQAFFNEERLELEKKRKKIRALQHSKSNDLASFKDLPSEIPIQLVIGTKVTARLRKPQDGLYTGTIDAVDTSNNTYRITFERQGLGTHSVPDYEVLSNEKPETIPITTIQNHFRPRNGWISTPSGLKSPVFSSTSKHRKDPLLSNSMVANSPTLMYHNSIEGKLGSYPVRFLEKIVLVKKILNVKRNKVMTLKSLNNEAERLMSFEQDIPEELERRFAIVLIELEKLNSDLQNYLEDMQSYCQQIAPEPSVAAMLAPSHLRERCREEARDIVDKHNAVITSEKGPCQNEDILCMITDLTALMLQLKCLSDTDQPAHELQVLQGTVEEIKRKLSPSNREVLQSCVEVHLRHIEVGLGHNKGDASAGVTKLS